MDFVLIIILGAVAIAALVKTSKLSDRQRIIEERFLALERHIASGAGATTPGAASPPESAPTETKEQIEQVTEQFREQPATATSPEPAQAEPKAVPTGSPPPPPPLSPPSVPAAPPGHTPGLEERFGTRWVVWVGGLALALGGIFLVKYTIDQGLIGPGVRLVLASLFAAALVAAGEWLRRQERTSGVAALPSAHIPGTLTAAGTTVGYATVWAAYELWGFLSPGAAFILLGIVALATLAAALLHGPALAGLGLIGAFITPLLVSTRDPNYWALYVYLAVVSAAAYALARMRMWRWLAITAVAFGFVWLLYKIDGQQFDLLYSHAFFVSAEFALVSALIVAGLFYGPSGEPGKIDWVSSTSLAVYIVGAGLFVLATNHGTTALTVFAALSIATIAIAWRTDAAAAAVPISAAFAVLIIMSWAFEADVNRLIAPVGPAGPGAPQPLRAGVNTHLALGAAYGILFAAAGFLAQGRSVSALVPILWSSAGVAAPIAILIGLYGRITHYERSIPFAFIALVLAALFSWIMEKLGKRAPAPGIAASEALYATGAVAALCLAFTFALEKGWLTIGLALMVPGIAWISEKRPLPMLRWLAAALVVLVVMRAGWGHIVGYDVGTTPIFNWLLYGYGVPAVGFWYAGHVLRNRVDDAPARMVDAAAILFTVLLAVLEIRHLMNDGDLYGTDGGLAELGTQVCVGLAMTIGLEHVRERTHSVIHNIGALVVAALTLFAIVFGLGIGVNPLVTGEPVGSLVFNLILVGYGLPAVLAIVLAMRTRGGRPAGYRICALVAAVALALAYLTLEVTRIYQGPILSAGAVTNAEQYTYSVVWLAFGVLLLVVGIFLRSQPARLASAAIVTLTIAKVFFVDLGGLTGVYRALSFIGLGIVLVGIGLLYQRLLFPQRGASVVAPTSAPPAG